MREPEKICVAYDKNTCEKKLFLSKNTMMALPVVRKTTT